MLYTWMFIVIDLVFFDTFTYITTHASNKPRFDALLSTLDIDNNMD